MFNNTENFIPNTFKSATSTGSKRNQRDSSYQNTINFAIFKQLTYNYGFRLEDKNMTKRDVLFVALKIMGIYFICLAILSLPNIGVYLSMGARFGQESTFMSFGSLLNAIIYPIWLLGFAYVFFRFSDSITELLIPDDTELPQIDINQYQKPIFTLSIRIFGVLCLTRGIPKLAEFLAKLYRIKQAAMPLSDETISSSDFGNVISAIIFLVLGGYLISGGRWLVAFAYKEKPNPELLNENSE